MNYLALKPFINQELTYSKICDIIGDIKTGGNKKKNQLQEWELYFAFSKQKNKFVIYKVYDKLISDENPYYALKNVEGKTVTYEQICELCNIQPQSGYDKRQQNATLAKFVDYVKVGNKYYIHQVYDSSNELAIISNNNKYTKYIAKFVLGMLYDIRQHNNEPVIFLSNRDILESTYMVNKNYFLAKNKPYKFIDLFSIHVNDNDVSDDYCKKEILDKSNFFLSASYRLLKGIVYRSMKILEQKSLLLANKGFRLYKNWVDDNGVFHSIQHNCTDEEAGRILMVQRRTVQQFNSQVPIDKYGNPQFYLKDELCAHCLTSDQRKKYYTMLNYNIQAEFIEEGYNAFSVVWRLTTTDTNQMLDGLQQLEATDMNKNICDKMLQTKDLQLIETALKEQFVDKFIRI